MSIGKPRGSSHVAEPAIAASVNAGWIRRRGRGEGGSGIREWAVVRDASWTTLCGSTGGELVVISFLEELLDVVRRFALFQEATKRFIAELARDILEGSQVIAGTFRRADQKKEELDSFAVERIEIDALVANAHRSNELLDTGMFGVGNRNPAADSGATELLSLHDGGDDVLSLIVGDFARVKQ